MKLRHFKKPYRWEGVLLTEPQLPLNCIHQLLCTKTMLPPSCTQPMTERDGDTSADPFLPEVGLFQWAMFAQGPHVSMIKTSSNLCCSLELLPPHPLFSPFTELHHHLPIPAPSPSIPFVSHFSQQIPWHLIPS